MNRGGLFLADRFEEILTEALSTRLVYRDGLFVPVVSGGSITASGIFGLSLEKMLIDTLGESLEAEDNKELLVTDTYTPNFDTHDFRDDITNEIGAGGGYSTGGVAITSTEVTLASGTLTFDAADTNYGASTTITSAMAGVIYTNVGSAATDQLIVLQDFVTAASSSSGSFVIQHHANGIFTIDYTP